MDSIRQNKVSNLILREVAEIFQRNAQGWVSGVLFTITKVKVSPDLLEAKIYVSVFPSKDAEKNLQKLTQHTSEIRNKLGQGLKNNLRRIPNLHFRLDDSLDYADRIDELLEN